MDSESIGDLGNKKKKKKDYGKGARNKIFLSI